MQNFIFLGLFCLLFLVSNFLELIVFNEELLLTFCFIAFLFCFYHYIRNTVQDALDSQFESVKQNYFDALKSRFDFIILQNLNLNFIIKLTQKLAVYELLHKYHSFFTIDLITNEAIVSNAVGVCKKELSADGQSKKNQIANLLLIEIFFNLVYVVLQSKYFSVKKTMFKKNVNTIKSNLGLLPL
jgi:ribosomal protein S17E